MKKNIKWFAAVLAALTLGYGAVSCGSDSKALELILSQNLIKPQTTDNQVQITT